MAEGLPEAMTFREARGADKTLRTRMLAEETPVALVYDGTSHAVLMCSPQDIEDFAIGFSLSEGIIERADEVERLEVQNSDLGIEAQLWLTPARRAGLEERRRFMAGPVGCGLCGLDSLAQTLRPLPEVSSGVTLMRDELARATDLLRARQPLHDATRAAHAAGFLKPAQGIVRAREDVGRHNALDKLLGALARSGDAPSDGALVMTSRLSLELIQKAALAACPILIGVSAPTARAVRIAEEAGITLIANAKRGEFEIYTHPHRITEAA